MRSLIYLIVAVAVLGSSTAIAQPEGISGGPVNVPTEGIIDGVFIQEHIPTKRMIPYEHVREADAIWSRRVFEYIDMREKINHTMYYPLDEITMAGVWVKNATRICFSRLYVLDPCQRNMLCQATNKTSFCL